jgi:hypothetical protein
MTSATPTPSWLRALAVPALLLSLFVCLSGFVAVIPIALTGHVDFRQLYTAGYMLRSGHGHQLYDYDATEKFQNALVSTASGALPFNHLACESLLFAPLSLLPYKTAYFAFLLLNLAVAAIAFRALRPYLKSLSQASPLLPLALFACFFPLTMALTEGQDSILLLALMIFAARALDRDADFTAGILVGLTLFKFQYGLPIVLLFLLWKKWRFLAGFAVSAVTLLLLSVVITGPTAFLSYLHSLTEMSSRLSSGNAIRYGIHPEAMPNLRGLVQSLTNASPHLTLIATAVLSLIVVAVAATKRSSLPLALLTAILVSYHHLITDAVMLFLPAIWALDRSLDSGANQAASRSTNWISWTSSLLLVSPAILLLAGARFYLLPILILLLLALL